MQRIKNAVLLGCMLLFVLSGVAMAENPANQTPFIISFTYQNIGSGTATVSFSFYSQASGNRVTTVSRTLPAGAGSSIFMGALLGSEALPSAFIGSAVMQSNQPLAIIQVQIPQSTTVKNRPLSIVFPSGSSPIYVATVLKNKFNAMTKLAVQNVHTTNTDLTLKFYNADDPAAAPIEIQKDNLPPGGMAYYDAGTLPGLADGFNGSAVVTGVENDTTTPANIVATTLELQTNDVGARAVEAISQAAKTLYVATALCNAFGGQTTAYAVQNTNLSTATEVTVHYSNGTNETKTAQPGAKVSFSGCAASGMPTGFSGAATITSSATDIIAIAKVSGLGYFTAFMAETAGASKLALPYIRYTSDANYNTGARQRAFIAIQNIGATDVSNVQVKYLDTNGTVVGTHTIATIAPNAKANSKAIDASGNSASLLEFGTPEGNPGSGFGGSVVIEGPAGSQLIAIARITSKIGAGEVAEDYNALVIDGTALTSGMAAAYTYSAPLVLLNQ